MTTEKKILSAVLYPLSRDVYQEWFIKYSLPNWNSGGKSYKKYKGLLNLVEDIDKRLSLAAEYISMLEKGDPLPSYQGMKVMPVKISPKSETDIVACCERWLTVYKTTNKRKATISQVKSYLNTFYKWLSITNRTKLAIGGLDEIAAQDFMLYLITDRKLCGSTHNDYKALLSRIWDMYQSKIRSNPWNNISRREHNTEHLKSYPLLIQKIVEEKLPNYDKQLWLAMQSVYYCATRPHSELRYLQIKHIDFDKGLITVPGEISKTHKERHINIYEGLLNQFVREGWHLCDPEYYLISLEGIPGMNHVGKNYLQRKWDAFRKFANIPSCYKLYGSKHTAGKKLTKATNTYITQEHFDHTSPATTQSYIEGIEKNELKFLQKEFPKFGAA